MRVLLRKYAPLLLLPLAALLAFLLFTGLVGARADREALRLSEQAVRRAAVQCYALEGAYPRDLARLETHYGLSLDKTRYFVDYQYIASNLMPEITVLAR